MKIGYIRTSILDDETSADRQRSILLREGVAPGAIVEDRDPAGCKCPSQQAAIQSLQSGMVLVVASLDRIAMSMQALTRLLTELSTRGAHLYAVAERIDTASDPDLYRVAGILYRYDCKVRGERIHAGRKAGRRRQLSNTGRQVPGAADLGALLLAPERWREIRAALRSGASKESLRTTHRVGPLTVDRYLALEAAGQLPREYTTEDED